MIYLTFNDQPSGIYRSQVIDVCRFWQSEFNIQVTLVAFIPYKKYFHNRGKIVSEYKGAFVFPIIPGMRWWKINFIPVFLFFFFRREKTIISRGVFAAYFANGLRKKGLVEKVVYDGRGAFSAELEEYRIISNPALVSELKQAEKEVVVESDFRIAVSNALVNYWRKEFNYDSGKHVIIPCTLSETKVIFPSAKEITDTRKVLGLAEEDIVFVYAGSSAGWQSFELVDGFFYDIFKTNPKYKLLFLTDGDIGNLKISREYKGRVFKKWVNPQEVFKILCACDYGVLFRENSVTNMVASPTKFAEYLQAGLPVLISGQVGDYSLFVSEHGCGFVVKENPEGIPFSKPDSNQKSFFYLLARQKFMKKSFRNEYKMLLDENRE